MRRLRVSGFTVFSTATRRVIWDTGLGTFLAMPALATGRRASPLFALRWCIAPVRRYDKCGDCAILT